VHDTTLYMHENTTFNFSARDLSLSFSLSLSLSHTHTHSLISGSLISVHECAVFGSCVALLIQQLQCLTANKTQLLPGILPHLGPDSLEHLKKLAGALQADGALPTDASGMQRLGSQ